MPVTTTSWPGCSVDPTAGISPVSSMPGPSSADMSAFRAGIELRRDDLAGGGVDADSLAGLAVGRDRFGDGTCGRRADARHLSDLVDGGGAELLQRAEVA